MTDLAYLTTIARDDLGVHPRSLYALRKQRLKRSADWPVPDQVLPNGQELYDRRLFVAWYLREVGAHWSAKGAVS